MENIFLALQVAKFGSIFCVCIYSSQTFNPEIWRNFHTLFSALCDHLKTVFSDFWKIVLLQSYCPFAQQTNRFKEKIPRKKILQQRSQVFYYACPSHFSFEIEKKTFLVLLYKTPF